MENFKFPFIPHTLFVGGMHTEVE